jgi:hypothetical protein
MIGRSARPQSLPREPDPSASAEACAMSMSLASSQEGFMAIFPSG